MNVNFDMNNYDIENAEEFRAFGVADGAGIGLEETTALTGLTTSHATGTADTSATPNTLALRDALGNFQSADPVADEDVATKAYVDAQAGGSGPCGSDPSPGDTCSDGMVYVTYNPYINKHIYVNPSRSVQLIPFLPSGWDTAFHKSINHMFEGCETAPNNVILNLHCKNPESITKYVANYASDSAFGYCDSLVEGGYDDWFLPGYSEVLIAAILGASTNMGVPGTTRPSEAKYWTSRMQHSTSAISPTRLRIETDGATNTSRPSVGSGGDTTGDTEVVCMRAE